LSKNNFSRT